MPLRTIAEINRKITAGDVVVCTASEFCDMVRADEDVRDVDVITSGTKGIMSGTYATLSFKATEANAFETARAVWLNGVPALVGPCPNERLGWLDLMVFGTAVSRSDQKYGGGHLFKDIIKRKNIEFEIITDSEQRLEGQITLDDMQFATLSATRNVFKNYSAFVNPNEGCVKSIFSVTCLEGPFKEASFCGCGEINPLEKDPGFETIGIGTKALFNGAVGYITGAGTRSSVQRPNLSGYAQLNGMDPRYIGGFNTSAGPDVLCSWAIPIPITNQRVLENAKRTDDDIPLPIVDVNGRRTIGYARYSDVWKRRRAVITYRKEACLTCEHCHVEDCCPTGAFKTSGGINQYECMRCGACLVVCPCGAFGGDLGSIPLNDMQIPVTLRQSDRHNAERLMRDLKARIERGEFLLSSPVDKIAVK
ncbi:MAG: methanogenesis marker 16 metalloprotein [Euryarchaeota archaeon]|nr:methanogenesis marker 16 metalloprotein [Euryarchaeota archaeon]